MVFSTFESPSLLHFGIHLSIRASCWSKKGLRRIRKANTVSTALIRVMVDYIKRKQRLLELIVKSHHKVKKHNHHHSHGQTSCAHYAFPSPSGDFEQIGVPCVLISSPFDLFYSIARATTQQQKNAYSSLEPADPAVCRASRPSCL